MLLDSMNNVIKGIFIPVFKPVFGIIWMTVVYTFVISFSPLFIIRQVCYMISTRGKPVEKIDISVEPSCLKDSNLGQHHSIHLKNRNVEIHYVANGSRSKPLMLFVHGFPEFWYSWRFQLREFSEDYYAVALDMIGYGESSKPTDASRYDVEELMKDIKEFILELGFESCVLVGHDWGGVLCYEVAYYYPEVVNQLVILNAPYATKLYRGLSVMQLLRFSYVCYFQIPKIPEYFFSRNNCESLLFMRGKAVGCKNKATMTQQDLVAYRYTFMKGGFTGPLNYYRQFLRCESFFSGLGRKKIGVPSLLVWGTDDKALGIDLAAFSAQFIEKFSIEYVEDASHWIQMERPDEVNDIIRKYL